MTIPFVSALPLRLPVPQNDMAGMLASWMDNSPDLGLSSVDCQGDLVKIGSLRWDIAQSLSEEKERFSESDGSPSESRLGVIEKLHEYYHILLECEKHGMVRHSNEDDLQSPLDHIALEWESAIFVSGPSRIQISRSIESERANVIWNLVSLQAHQASKENLPAKIGWTKASKGLQNAASWLGHLLVLLQTQGRPTQRDYFSSEMSPKFVLFWQALLLAQAQQCDYESRCVNRVVHAIAAKLAAAAAALYGEVDRIARIEDDLRENTSSLTQCSELVLKLAHFARAWAAYMSYKAEYHQSQIHRSKKECGQELARLEAAYKHAVICKTLCEESPSGSGLELLDGLRTAVDEAVNFLRSLMDTADRENKEKYKQNIPALPELPEIKIQKTAKCDESISKLLRPKTNEPIFQRRSNNATQSAEDQNRFASINSHNTVMKNPESPLVKSRPPPSLSASSFLDQQRKAPPVVKPSPNLETYAEVFRVEMSKTISELAHDTEDYTESARLALLEVQLPHSLTAFRQEQSGGGLPEDLWQRVHLIQEHNKLIHLKQDLWELRDAADMAREMHKEMTNQLERDVNSDREFRETHPEFEGQNTGEHQALFLNQLAKYDRLLSSAQEGDSIVFQRLEQLDIEPKYNLLQYPKSQLDRLLPGAKGSAGHSEIVRITEHLSNLLGDLSILFQERNDLMNMFEKELNNFDIIGALNSKVDPMKGSDNDYLEAIKHSQRAFDGIKYEIQQNMTRQDELLGSIFSENEQFMSLREQTANSQSADSCIVMIEEAIEEIDQLSKHSNDGRDFYNVVIPKLRDLKERVISDSARLENERCEYHEKEQRTKQEQNDALMAQKLSAKESVTSSNQQKAENDAVSAPTPTPTPEMPLTTATISSNISTPPGTSIPSVTEDSLQVQSLARYTDDVSEPPAPNSQGTITNSHETQTADDEKVATLVEMNFDANKVVAALEKHDNDVNKALNELLSC